MSFLFGILQFYMLEQRRFHTGMTDSLTGFLADFFGSAKPNTLK